MDGETPSDDIEASPLGDKGGVVDDACCRGEREWGDGDGGVENAPEVERDEVGVEGPTEEAEAAIGWIATEGLHRR